VHIDWPGWLTAVGTTGATVVALWQSSEARREAARMRGFEAFVLLDPRIVWQRRAPAASFQQEVGDAESRSLLEREVSVLLDFRLHGGDKVPLLKGDHSTRFDLELKNHGRGPANLLRATRSVPPATVSQAPTSTVLGPGDTLPIAVVVAGLDVIFQKPFVLEFGYEDAFGKAHTIGLQLRCDRIADRTGQVEEAWTVLRYVPG
jgi:hypothetical protein